MVSVLLGKKLGCPMYLLLKEEKGATAILKYKKGSANWIIFNLIDFKNISIG